MSVLSAQTIRRLGLLSPCAERGVAGGMSFGLAQCGYDLRLAQWIEILPREFELASRIFPHTE